MALSERQGWVAVQPTVALLMGVCGQCGQYAPMDKYGHACLRCSYAMCGKALWGKCSGCTIHGMCKECQEEQNEAEAAWYEGGANWDNGYWDDDRWEDSPHYQAYLDTRDVTPDDIPF